MRKKHLKLTEHEESYLTKLTTCGQAKARTIRRARTLLLLNQGKTMSDVSRLLDYSYPRVVALKKSYQQSKLQCLDERPRPGRPPIIDALTRAKLTALACTNPPEGRARWSLRLLADKAVELDFVSAISHNEVGRIIKKTNSNHTLKSSGV
jgi:hypothetical protein